MNGGVGKKFDSQPPSIVSVEQVRGFWRIIRGNSAASSKLGPFSILFFFPPSSIAVINSIALPSQGLLLEAAGAICYNLTSTAAAAAAAETASCQGPAAVSAITHLMCAFLGRDEKFDHCSNKGSLL